MPKPAPGMVKVLRPGESYREHLDFTTPAWFLREVPIEDLVLALKDSSEEMREKVFENVSSRAAEQIREDAELLGPVRRSEVERVQVRIVEIARRLEDEGRIELEEGEHVDAML